MIQLLVTSWGYIALTASVRCWSHSRVDGDLRHIDAHEKSLLFKPIHLGLSKSLLYSCSRTHSLTHWLTNSINH